MARTSNKKKAGIVVDLWQKADGAARSKWRAINQQGYDFYLGEQISNDERDQLEAAGMPTFIINRITPVIETMKFFVTAGDPRWQAVGAEESDIDVSAVHADLMDYCWNLSNGKSVFSNVILDSLTKSVGYFMMDVDPDMDKGMGEVVFKRVDPFDVFPDPMSRDPLLRDASYVIVKKDLPKEQLKALIPDYALKVKKANPVNASVGIQEYFDRDFSSAQHIQHLDLGADSYQPETGDMDTVIDFYECYMKTKEEFVNVFIKAKPSRAQMQAIEEKIADDVQQFSREKAVEIAELKASMEEALMNGEVIEERAALEIEKAEKNALAETEMYAQQLRAKAAEEIASIENVIMDKAEFDIRSQDDVFTGSVVDAIPFFEDRVQVRCVAGDTFLYEFTLPIKDYPMVPIPYLYTGTPFAMSAVTPLVGKQQEINKSHQILIHNANLSSNLRWLYEEGSVPEDEWEQYSSSPGALLKYRQGFAPPTAVQPLPLNNAFFGITQEGKGDMEYLSGISSSMQGATGGEHETYRGMLALDEFGTRRIKAWMHNIVEPALEHIGRIFKDLAQATYQTNKVFRIVQPNNVEKAVEINIPIYNDLGNSVEKFNDYPTAQFDVRIIAGSTMPINRWALIDEYFRWYQAGLIDDIAMLAETDIRNKETIMKRKSLYAQMQSQLEQLQETLSDREGTIETLERQLVQSGIKQKGLQADGEIRKAVVDTQAKAKIAAGNMAAQATGLSGAMKAQQDNES